MPLTYSKFQQFFSAPRLQNYEIVCLGDLNKTIKLYYTNLRLSQAFYPLLSLTEVILRNSLSDLMSTHFSDPNWLISQQTGFMIDPSLSYRDRRTHRLVHNHFLKKSVEKSVSDCIGPVTPGKIIANLQFGFWVALFDTTHYRILTGVPIRIFNNLPPGGNRNSVHRSLLKIRDFRNRVYHNEPIIFDKDSSGNTIFGLTSSKEIYQEIQEIFHWLDLDYKLWARSIDNIKFEIERAECMMDVFPSNFYYLHRLIIGIKHYTNKYIRS